ncbi:MAG: DUF839 domain-containing protein [Enhygromyxa sp.]
MSLGRRKFLASSATTGLVAALASLGTGRRARARGPWGELIPDPDGILDLPAGFTYEILETGGADMSDGYRVPRRPDGMACFAGPDNTLILMRNHENNLDDLPNGPYKDGQSAPEQAYDPAATGAVTRLVVDATTFERISSNLVLTGTIRNCAGGPSPWGWLSCEEIVSINGELRHGYTFVCPIDAETVQPPAPIVSYGRYRHEAVCIDPSNNYAYLTEDQINSCLYRFVPDDMAEPFVGKLQALKVVGEEVYNTSLMEIGEVVEVEWVDVDEPDPDEDTVRAEAQSKGAALIFRGEGIWFFEGQVYVCATAGGPLLKGQIFRLIDGDNPTLELITRSDSISVLDNPDNITVAPWGDVYIAEDGDGDQYIRFVNAAGEVCDFARNAKSSAELAGVCFSPSGDALFFNMFGDNLTVVVTGPFPGVEPGDGDGDPGDGDGDPGDGDGDPGDGDSEVGDDEETGEAGDETGAEGDAGIESGDDGCGCSTDGERASSGAALTVAALAGVAALTRTRDDD